MKKFIVYPVLLLLAAASVALTAIMTKRVTTKNEKEEKVNKPQKKVLSSNVIGQKAKKVLKKLELSKLKLAKSSK